MISKAVRFVNLVLAGLLAGNEFGTKMALHPALEELSTPERIRAEQAVTRRYGAILPLWMSSTVASCVAALALSRGSRGFLPTLAGTACFAAMLLSTLLGNVPINKRTLEIDPTRTGKSSRSCGSGGTGCTPCASSSPSPGSGCWSPGCREETAGERARRRGDGRFRRRPIKVRALLPLRGAVPRVHPDGVFERRAVRFAGWRHRQPEAPHRGRGLPRRGREGQDPGRRGRACGWGGDRRLRRGRGGASVPLHRGGPHRARFLRPRRIRSGRGRADCSGRNAEMK